MHNLTLLHKRPKVVFLLWPYMYLLKVLVSISFKSHGSSYVSSGSYMATFSEIAAHSVNIMFFRAFTKRMIYYTDRSRLTSQIYNKHYEGSECI